MMKYSIDIAKCYNWLDFMVRFLIQIVYRGTKAVRISDFKEHMKQSLFLWGSVFAPENLSLLGEATPCCLVTEKLGMVEQSSSIHTSTAHTHTLARERKWERENWAKSSLRCEERMRLNTRLFSPHSPISLWLQRALEQLHIRWRKDHLIKRMAWKVGFLLECGHLSH